MCSIFDVTFWEQHVPCSESFKTLCLEAGCLPSWSTLEQMPHCSNATSPFLPSFLYFLLPHDVLSASGCIPQCQCCSRLTSCQTFSMAAPLSPACDGRLVQTDAPCNQAGWHLFCNITTEKQPTHKVDATHDFCSVGTTLQLRAHLSICLPLCTCDATPQRFSSQQLQRMTRNNVSPRQLGDCSAGVCASPTHGHSWGSRAWRMHGPVATRSRDDVNHVRLHVMSGCTLRTWQCAAQERCGAASSASASGLPQGQPPPP